MTTPRTLLDPAGTGTSAVPEVSTILTDALDTACVVIVDDEPANVTLLERILRAAGVSEVHGITDPRQALQRCQEVCADLVLLDLHMPGHDGFDVLAELDEHVPQDAFLPVLVLTADSTPEMRNRALHAGATDFLTKPLDRIEVLLRVRNLLQTRALYVDVQARNAHMAAELDRRQAEERQAEQLHRDRLSRVNTVIARRDFTMVYQPIVDLTTCAIVGAEALARFTAEPHRPPNEWFAEAATVGRSGELEVAAAAAGLSELRHLPDEMFLTLNVSPIIATSAELVGLLGEFPAERIVLELTEHNIVDDYGQLLAGLTPLRERGVRIAVDDAGAGYAGLSHVLQLRPDVLKLDLDLIRGIDTDPAKRALAAALVTFAHETGSTIIAEGIETPAELATLQALHVRWGQGYHLARPAALPLPTSPLEHSACSD